MKMHKLGCRVHLHHYAEFIHGFCNFDHGSAGVREFSRATQNIIGHLREMLEIEAPAK